MSSVTEELTFHTEKSKKQLQYLTFLPKPLRGIALLGIIVNLITLILAGVSFPFLQDVLPLFYSQAADQQLASKIFLLFIPLFATAITIIHLSIVRLARDSNLTILRIFVIATFVIELLALAVLARIILIVS